MKMTLIEMVQDILSEMDGDEVNSFTDTAEAEQVSQIIKTTYMEMMSNRNWPHLKKLVKFNSSTNTALPTHQTLSQDIKEICFIRYDVRSGDETRRKYNEMKYKSPEDFLSFTNTRNSDKAEVVVVTDPAEGVEIMLLNNVAPQYFTSFDEEVLVFDAYDNTTGQTLITNRFQAQAYVSPSWVMEDDAAPDLPSEAFAALLEESKSVCFHALKQMNNDKAEQKARRQQRWLAQKSWAVADLEVYPNYGRKRAARNQNPYIDKNN